MQDNIYVLPKRRAAKVGQLPPHNLPAQLTFLIGREQETQAICAILRRPETHLLTLLGTGGIGKTRLGLRVALDLLHDFPGGVFFIALAPISDPELVIPAIAQTLGLRETPERSPLEGRAFGERVYML
ncbi:MAG: hypothetical protein ACJ788_04025 [Ktedonobacteraceae bacterium]|jgi:hypothetical protein